MKKSLLTLLGVGLLLTSCQSDEPFAPIEGGEKQVTFTLNVPGELGTRAGENYNSGVGGASNVGAANIKYTLVLDANGDTRVFKDATVSNDGRTATFTPTVVLGRDYTITAYASFDDNTSINAKADIEAITVSKNFNNESKDAYFQTTTHNFANADLQPLTLTRPFGKLRLVATDYKATGNGNTAIKSVKVKYNNNVFTTFNAVRGEFSNPQPYEYTLDGTNYSTSYYAPEVDGQTIFADYIPVNETGVAPFTVTVEYENGETYTREFAEDIPVKRNALTTLKGNFFTAGAQITVNVEDNFDGGEYNNPIAVSSVDELEAAIANPTGDIVLQNDINLGSEMLVINAPSTRSNTISNIVINLNGKTVTSTAKKAFEVHTNATFKNGKIEAANRCIDTRTAVNLVLDNVTLIADEYTSYGNPQPLTIGGNDDGTEVTMNNVEISAEAGYGIITFVETNLTATNSNISGYSALYVKPGSDNSEFNFKNTELSGSTANNDVEGNSFSTIAPRANNVTINVDGDSKVIATGNYCYALSLGSKFENEKEIFGAKVTILGTIEGNILASGNLNDNIITVDKQYKEALEAKGYTVEIVNGNAVIINAVYVTNASELQKAVTGAKGGETIKLTNNIKFGEKFYDNGGWKDGLGYRGDKSFTIDLNGYTIDQDGKLNDYLLWIKNEGSKANTITIKNGTLDAGTTAYCALCTASSHDNKLTINLENVTLINNIINGSTVKVRAGSELNVNAGTKITGKNSYLGIENWKATVNIYDGAEIYMNGTSSYNGCLVGVGGAGTINVYGGYGKGVKGGFIAMTSGGTINVSGGEWIANTDGTIGDNSNLYVLTAQSNRYESGFAGPSVINVTGGTFRGGMDAWVLNNLEGEKAELNISGGNFNANPTRYLEDGKTANEANGIWTVK